MRNWAGLRIAQLATILWGESYFSGVRAFKGAEMKL